MDLFETIRTLLREVDITQADVVEGRLILKKNKDVGACLENLIRLIEVANCKRKGKEKSGRGTSSLTKGGETHS